MYRHGIDSRYCWERYGLLINDTIEWFKRMGPRYRSKPWRYEFLLRYSSGVGLDLGCGLASTTRYLLESGYLKQLVLLDIVEETMFKACTSDHRVQCIVGDLLDPPFKDRVFDTIYLLAVLHHIPGDECRRYVIERIHEMLKPGGVLIITVWYPVIDEVLSGREYVELGVQEYLLIDGSGRRYYYFYTEDELISLINEHGFEVVEKGVFIQNPGKPGITRNLYIVAKCST